MGVLTSIEGSNPSFSVLAAATMGGGAALGGPLSPPARLRPRARASQHCSLGLRRASDEPEPRRSEVTCISRRGGRAVECGGLENRFGPLGPTRVQIPPPPPDSAETGLKELGASA